jgi:hypothetical protein
LEKSTRGELAHALHQCARFSTSPKVSHAEAVKYIGRYLHRTKDEGIIFDPKEHSFECWVDADFCGGWDPATAEHDSTTARSRTGYVIKYAGCPIIWQSRLQTDTALSTHEAEYIALSTALRKVITMMQILEEAKAQGIEGIITKPEIHCKAFEDNTSVIDVATMPKMKPRTRTLNVKYHHFRDYVFQGKISIHAVRTQDQQGDLFTKNTPLDLFRKFRKLIFGW